MNYLVFDCVLNKTYITLVEDDKKTSKTVESNEKNYHSVYLAEEIQTILKNNNLKFENLDFLGTDIGPASFTGIRVGLCIAKVMASEASISCVPIRSVDILSEIVEGEKSAVFLDARRGSYIYFNPRINEPVLIPQEEALKTAKNLDIKIVSDTNCADFFAINGIKTLNYERGEYKIGEILAKLALEKFNSMPVENFTAESIKPLYIQTPPVFKKN